MSIFVTILAFNDEVIISHSKIAILAGSLITGFIGFLFLKMTLTQRVCEDEYVVDESKTSSCCNAD
jgi:Na+/H+ antiporter NhaA